MWDKLWPLLLIVASNTFYNICTKSMPEDLNPFGALTVTYLTGALLSFILCLSSLGATKAIEEVGHLNWTPFVLGISIVGLELGYIYLYRAGWLVSVGSLVSNICLAIVLVFIGFFFYKETITLKQIAGIILCCLGLGLIT